MEIAFWIGLVVFTGTAIGNFFDNDKRNLYLKRIADALEKIAEKESNDDRV